MIEKNRKLQCQFEAEASTSSRGGSDSEKPIFEGVSIFVNGLTVPCSQDLRKYMLKHGGRFENYFSRHCVTHIICSNLPDRKIKNLRYPIEISDAYERLLLDAIEGERRLCIRSDELDAAWALFPPLLKQLEEKKIAPELYPYGSRGPVGAHYLAAKYNVRWGDLSG